MRIVTTTRLFIDFSLRISDTPGTHKKSATRPVGYMCAPLTIYQYPKRVGQLEPFTSTQTEWIPVRRMKQGPRPRGSCLPFDDLPALPAGKAAPASSQTFVHDENVSATMRKQSES